MSGRTFDTKTGSISASRKGDAIAITVASQDGYAMELLTLDDARLMAAELLKLADGPAPKVVDRGHVEMRDATPAEVARAARAMPKPGSGDPS